MRKTVKHAHTHGHKHTLQPSTGTLNFSIRTLQVYVVLLTFFYIDVFFLLSPHYGCSLCLGLWVWMHAGNICAFRGLTHPPQQGVTWAEFIRVPTWSFLDLWGLVKGSNGRNTERALSTAAQLWLSVVSAHSLFPHFKDCVYLWHSWIGTMTFGWLTWAGLWECGF